MFRNPPVIEKFSGNYLTLASTGNIEKGPKPLPWPLERTSFDIAMNQQYVTWKNVPKPSTLWVASPSTGLNPYNAHN